MKLSAPESDRRNDHPELSQAEKEKLETVLNNFRERVAANPELANSDEARQVFEKVVSLFQQPYTYIPDESSEVGLFTHK